MDHTARDALLDWYDRSARDLPWRRTRDPYAIWVSEIMLQQTRVDTVIPYFERFMERFPTVSELAGAPEDDVMALWSGLGYYRRARLLHQGAREVRERYGGEVPEGAEARRSLPGVGRYTCGAIGSIAFDRPEPIVDGNVARVLARLELVDSALGRADTDRRLWELARALVRGPRPGALNQSLMELGATLCTPTSPACSRCPVSRDCGALAENRVDELPVPKARKRPRPVSLVAIAARVGRPPRTWLIRGTGSLFGGLFGLPMGEGSGRGRAREVLREAGIVARLAQGPCGRIEHVLSHRHLTVDVFRATAARATSTLTTRALSLEELDGLGVSQLTRKILAAAPPE